MGSRIKNSNILGVHWKIRLWQYIHMKNNYNYRGGGGGLPKKGGGGQFPDLCNGEGWGYG